VLILFFWLTSFWLLETGFKLVFSLLAQTKPGGLLAFIEIYFQAQLNIVIYGFFAGHIQLLLVY